MNNKKVTWSSDLVVQGRCFSKHDLVNPGLASILIPLKYIINGDFSKVFLPFSFDSDLSS